MSDPYEEELERRGRLLLKTSGQVIDPSLPPIKPGGKGIELDSYPQAKVGRVCVFVQRGVMFVQINLANYDGPETVYVSPGPWRDHIATRRGELDPYTQLLALEELRSAQLLDDLADV